MYYNSLTNGFYDLDINPSIPDGSVEISHDYYIELLQGQTGKFEIKSDSEGYPVLIAEVDTPTEIIEGIVKQIQLKLDAFARTRNYDSILSACTYATSNIPKFSTEGQYCVDARDSMWSAAYSVLADVNTGVIPIPESISDIEHLLPQLSWPE